MEITTWQAAAERGLTHYCTGNPCPRGHLAQRFVSNKGCVECARLTPAEKLAVAVPRTFRFPNLHSDDHAEARAFCQMLQARRGTL
jgi:hypothetical protein